MKKKIMKNKIEQLEKELLYFKQKLFEKDGEITHLKKDIEQIRHLLDVKTEKEVSMELSSLLEVENPDLKFKYGHNCHKFFRSIGNISDEIMISIDSVVESFITDPIYSRLLRNNDTYLTTKNSIRREIFIGIMTYLGHILKDETDIFVYRELSRIYKEDLEIAFPGAVKTISNTDLKEKSINTLNGIIEYLFQLIQSSSMMNIDDILNETENTGWNYSTVVYTLGSLFDKIFNNFEDIKICNEIANILLYQYTKNYSTTKFENMKERPHRHLNIPKNWAELYHGYKSNFYTRSDLIKYTGLADTTLYKFIDFTDNGISYLGINNQKYQSIKKLDDETKKMCFSDSYIEAFVDNMCIVDSGDFCISTPVIELFTAYKEFRKQHDGRIILDEEKISFSKQLKKYTGCISKKKRHPNYKHPVHCYRGIKLK